MIQMLTDIDGIILLLIQEAIRNPILTPFFTALTWLGDGGRIWIVIAVLLLIFKKTRKLGCMVALALLGSLLINNMLLKNLVARTRPYDAIEGLVPLVAKPTDYSFPSGHTAAAFAAASVLYRKLPKSIGIPTILLALLISLSRLYVGVHYPSDVLCGMISGIAISYGAEWVAHQIYKHKSNIQK